MTVTPSYIRSLVSGPPTPPEPNAFDESNFAPADPERAELREIDVDFPRELIDPDAVKVVRRLNEAGFEAYLVGGCVRDLLFGLAPKDFDLVTSAHPNEVRRVFRNCRIIGRRFRLAHVYFRDKILEVATFRAMSEPTSEESEANGDDDKLLIRDDNVFGTREQDVLRRDFTINALLYDVGERKILDHTGGVADAEARVVRSIGDPDRRMQEDPIRMLRAIRLAARLGCTIEDATWAAVCRHRESILDAAKPRILEDVLRMFRGGAIAPAFDMLITSGVLGVILPELRDHLRHCAEIGDEEELEALRRVLRCADRRAADQRTLSAAQQLSLLLSPLLLADPHDGEAIRSPTERAGARMRPVANRLSISRKDGERIRQIVLTLPKMIPSESARKRKRRAGPSVLLKRSYFPEALEVFDVFCDATGELRDTAEDWRQRFSEAVESGVASSPKEDEAKEDRAPRKRSSRRRGGRGRGRRRSGAPKPTS